MDFNGVYGPQITKVIEESPVSLIGKQLERNAFLINTAYFMQLYLKVFEIWENLKKYDINIIFEISKIEESDKDIDDILREKFSTDISEVIKAPNKRSIIYKCMLDGQGIHFLLEDKVENKLLISESIEKSYENESSLVFHMYKVGIDAFIGGVSVLSCNNTNIYELMRKSTAKELSIEYYEKLLKGYYEDRVKFDKMDRFLQKNNGCSSDWQQMVKEDPYLLVNRPEEKFQKDLIDYFKIYCSDTVLREVPNLDEDRYDIWISSSINEIYIFEIKWLGKSITSKGNIFSKYNTAKRAVEGAYQLVEYIKKNEQEAVINEKGKIKLGVLVVFDARQSFETIKYPNEVEGVLNLDLKQHFKIEPKPYNASQAMQHLEGTL
ncbi:hypothetical protein IA940_00400 [Listeria marthii]|uniref:hypothetical protein n=1 Tax=Listeria marthii TaxID=529731 RepID=UPI0018892316|nr:hypothetical protein [Listeria marthii]MBF2518378.1 hypothetical protein [Listeria marthii]